MTRTRSWRRKHNNRMKRKAIFVVEKIQETPGRLVWANKNYNHLKACDCEMCRNSRRGPYKEKTWKEKRQDEADRIERSIHDSEGTVESDIEARSVLDDP